MRPPFSTTKIRSLPSAALTTPSGASRPSTTGSSVTATRDGSNRRDGASDGADAPADGPGASGDGGIVGDVGVGSALAMGCGEGVWGWALPQAVSRTAASARPAAGR